MKQLVLCRHAKSSWKYPVKDIYRPLNKRGIHQAPEMAQTCQLAPDLVLCSPAVRAWSTALCYFEELKWDYALLRIEPKLIEASLSQLMDVIESVPVEVDSLFLFGHNPGFNDLIAHLAKQSLPETNLVTSGRVTLSLPCQSWRPLLSNSAKIVQWVTPQ